MNNNYNKEEEYRGMVIPGFIMLFINIIVLPLIGLFSVMRISDGSDDGLYVFILILAIIATIFLLSGYFIQEPNQARVITFFGKYCGTCRKVGYYWINPFMSSRKISLRLRNMDINPIKVNDKIGNPVMIGMVLVWKINDTYRAAFDIDSESLGVHGRSFSVDAFTNFVSVQSDAALREVTGKFPYDSEHDHETSLRSSAEEINELLEKKINERLEMAGMKVIEARINYLAYAPEIASVMLKRQQASAVISAREKIVEGAVSMVKLALDSIEKDKIAQFSQEQRAQTVSNLMLVLCSDEPVSPVINTNK